MLNRTIAPDFKQIDAISFVEPVAQQLDNGIKVFTINAGQQELVRIEFIFENVNWDSTKPLQAVAVNGLINNGTKQLSARQIAEKIDYYGAFLQTDYAADYLSVTLYSLNKHLEPIFPILWSIFNESIFPENELAIFRQNQQQKLSVNLKKNDFIARKTFSNAVFGHTPYGADINLSDYENLQRADLINYYQAAFQPSCCTIIASGKFEAKEFDLLNQFFGSEWENSALAKRNEFVYEPVGGQEIYIEKPESIQSALRLGKLSINRTHADFPSLQVVNTIFGGYFGSRLMNNIREDKGYTYGIGSGIASLRDAGYFFIATEVGTAVCADTLIQIEKEIDTLKNELISEEELNLVRNYMLGSMLGSLENAFSHADKFKNIYFSGLDYGYYQRYVSTVKSITPERIQAIAQQYLNWDEMTKVVVGKR